MFSGQAPKNAQFHCLCLDGIDGCAELESGAPDDVQSYIVRLFNCHQNGSGFSLQQFFTERDRMAELWKLKKECSCMQGHAVRALFRAGQGRVDA